MLRGRWSAGKEGTAAPRWSYLGVFGWVIALRVWVWFGALRLLPTFQVKRWILCKNILGAAPPPTTPRLFRDPPPPPRRSVHQRGGYPLFIVNKLDADGLTTRAGYLCPLHVATVFCHALEVKAYSPGFATEDSGVQRVLSHICYCFTLVELSLRNSGVFFEVASDGIPRTAQVPCRRGYQPSTMLQCFYHLFYRVLTIWPRSRVLNPC